jgi:hypothetical protein
VKIDLTQPEISFLIGLVALEPQVGLCPELLAKLHAAVAPAGWIPVSIEELSVGNVFMFDRDSVETHTVLARRETPHGQIALKLQSSFAKEAPYEITIDPSRPAFLKVPR